MDESSTSELNEGILSVCSFNDTYFQEVRISEKEMMKAYSHSGQAVIEHTCHRHSLQLWLVVSSNPVKG